MEDLCRGCPPEFAAFMNMCRTMPHRTVPDYSMIRKPFIDAFEKYAVLMPSLCSFGTCIDYLLSQIEDDGVFDWMLRSQKDTQMCCGYLNFKIGRDGGTYRTDAVKAGKRWWALRVEEQQLVGFSSRDHASRAIVMLYIPLDVNKAENRGRPVLRYVKLPVCRNAECGSSVQRLSMLSCGADGF